MLRLVARHNQDQTTQRFPGIQLNHGVEVVFVVHCGIIILSKYPAMGVVIVVFIKGDQQMSFVLGKSGNPLGRPKRRSLISEDYQAFYEQNKEDLQKVFQKVIVSALEDSEPWAMKLCLEYFCPKPERSVAVTKEETRDVNVNMTAITQGLSFEDKQTFLRIWMQTKRGIPAFRSNELGSTLEGEVEAEDDEEILEDDEGSEKPKRQN